MTRTNKNKRKYLHHREHREEMHREEMHREHRDVLGIEMKSSCSSRSSGKR
ncbi:MAG: hypothetical protein WCK13_11580 [Ignavibacteriota bacterium]